jgi:hypothetical protein
MADGEIVIFARNNTLFEEVRKLKIGDKVRFTGVIEPRNPQLQSNSPYFLNPVFLEKLNSARFELLLAISEKCSPTLVLGIPASPAHYR